MVGRSLFVAHELLVFVFVICYLVLHFRVWCVLLLFIGCCLRFFVRGCSLLVCFLLLDVGVCVLFAFCSCCCSLFGVSDVWCVVCCLLVWVA